MGEEAEYCLKMEENAHLDLMFGEPTEFRHLNITQGEPIWVTGDNQHIEIKDMETSHIQNSIAKCIRDNWRTTAIPLFEAELQRKSR
jgi:hypothetical protein